jgi:hypothetical protein
VRVCVITQLWKVRDCDRAVAFKKILIRETVSVRSCKEKIDVKVNRHGDVHCEKS